MALWGVKDLKTATGSISIATTGIVTGTGTLFTTESKVGNTIRVLSTGLDYTIVSITSNTVCQVISGQNNGNAAVTAATAANLAWTLSEKPAFVSHESSDSGTTGTAGLADDAGGSGDSTKVFGVSVEEASSATTGNRGYHAGWVRRTIGTGGRAGRTFYETLVANGTTITTSDDQADDTQFPDA